MAIIINPAYSGQWVDWLLIVMQWTLQKSLINPSIHHHNNSPCHKIRTLRISLLSAWSNQAFHEQQVMRLMQQTCTPISSITNLTIHHPTHTINHNYIMNHNWRLRGTQPNPTTKIIACSFISCPYRMNNSYYNV